MAKYFMEIPHEEQDCAQAIQLLNIRGYIGKLEWGCSGGNHTGVIITEADSKDQLLNILPPLLRPKARVVELNTFTPEDVEALHLSRPLSAEEQQAATE